MTRIIPITLLAAAVPALLAAQTSGDCPDCQVAPYFAGDGGFVGEPADVGDLTEVTIILTCEQTTVTTRVQPDSDGIVRQALNRANGRNCPEGARGTLEVDNLKPGAWYWINDGQNSAVSAFFPKEVVDNEQIDVTDPGGVEVVTPSGGIATYVKHAGTGRVGIIPRIVPTKPVPGCSGTVGQASAGDCRLGSPDDWRLTVEPSEIIRPTGTRPEKEFVVTLHGEDFITTRTHSARGAIEHHTSVTGIRLAQDGGAQPGAREDGVLKWSVFVGASDDRCLAANNHPDRRRAQEITFSIEAMDGTIPGLADDGLETTLTVNCPDDSAAAQPGTDLVPENPFPVD